MKLLIAPHDDDVELFAAFTCLREKPVVVICTDSYTQAARGLPVEAEQRHLETLRGLDHLGVAPQDVVFLGVPDNLEESYLTKCVITLLEELDRRVTGADSGFLPITKVWAPAYADDGHKHHNAIALAAGAVFGDRMQRRYLTYTTKGKQIDGEKVPILQADWIRRKLLALSCHASQFDLDPRMGCWPHFLRSQEEFYEC